MKTGSISVNAFFGTGNTAQNSPDNRSSYPLLDSSYYSDVDYQRGEGPNFD